MIAPNLPDSLENLRENYRQVVARELKETLEKLGQENKLELQNALLNSNRFESENTSNFSKKLEKRV